MASETGRPDNRQNLETTESLSQSTPVSYESPDSTKSAVDLLNHPDFGLQLDGLSPTTVFDRWQSPDSLGLLQHYHTLETREDKIAFMQ